MSSTDSSPMKYGSGNDMNFVGTDPNFTAEISNKMRVPRKIRVGDTGENDDVGMGWGRPSLGTSSEKYAMQVPDRIMVTGKDQHMGSKALPRELQLESNLPMPPDPEMIRIQTPPRQITLLNSRPESYMSTDPEDGDETLIVENDRARFGGNDALPNGTVMMYQERNSFSRKNKVDSALMNQGDMNEEVVHLREQLSRMNRRVLALEEDTIDRKERERYMVMASLLYIAYKAVSWLFRSGHQH